MVSITTVGANGQDSHDSDIYEIVLNGLENLEQLIAGFSRHLCLCATRQGATRQDSYPYKCKGPCLFSSSSSSPPSQLSAQSGLDPVDSSVSSGLGVVP